MPEEEYAIVSKKEFQALKDEIQKIKKHPLVGSKMGETLQESIDNLNMTLNSMMEVFKEAAEELKLEERETQLLAKKIDPIAKKMDTIIDQNQKIAKGIVAVADMVKEEIKKPKPEEALRPKLPPLGAPGAPMGPPPPGMPPRPGPMPPPGVPPGPGPLPPPGMPPGPGPMPPPGAPPPGMPPLRPAPRKK